MFERFTERARQVVVLAQEEARLMGHNYIGTEHILLGLFREEEGIGARVLGRLGLTYDAIKQAVIEDVGISDDEPRQGQLAFTPRAKKILELALREAISLGHNYIGTEHILLGLIREHDSRAMRLVEAAGVTREQIRNDAIRMLSGPGSPRLRDEAKIGCDVPQPKPEPGWWVEIVYEDGGTETAGPWETKPNVKIVDGWVQVSTPNGGMNLSINGRYVKRTKTFEVTEEPS